MKITPTSLTVSQLLGQTNERYVIPPYQRRYSWLERQIGELIDDISLIEGSDTHLLGSIVCLARDHAADLNPLEVVDGHVRMLRLAWQTRDVPEVLGQLMRLALVLVGHALRRLPRDNVGRATVNAFRTMEPPPEVRRVQAWAAGGAAVR